MKPFAYEIRHAMSEPELSYKKDGINSIAIPLYTHAQLYAALAKARKDALEEAAQVVERDAVGTVRTQYQEMYNGTVKHVADSIRKLKEST